MQSVIASRNVTNSETLDRVTNNVEILKRSEEFEKVKQIMMVRIVCLWIGINH